MDKLSNHLILDYKFNDKEKLMYFENLIVQAYNYNPNFKKMDKLCVKNNLDSILKGMKQKYYESSHETIISIISVLRLWNRHDLPSSFIYDYGYSNRLQMQRQKIIQNLNSNL
jgi:hypothetical protein